MIASASPCRGVTVVSYTLEVPLTATVPELVGPSQSFPFAKSSNVHQRTASLVRTLIVTPSDDSSEIHERVQRVDWGSLHVKVLNLTIGSRERQLGQTTTGPQLVEQIGLCSLVDKSIQVLEMQLCRIVVGIAAVAERLKKEELGGERST